MKNINTKHKLFRIHLAVYKKIMQNLIEVITIPLEISSYSDAPVGSGLGSSSTLTVCLIKGLCAYLNKKISKVI